MPDAVAVSDRRQAIGRFLKKKGWGDVTPEKLAADASFRSYWRLRRGGETVVLMDAPPPDEDVRPFVMVAEVLRGFGLSAPEIHAADAESGLLLIEDFGDDTYTRLLAHGSDETALYTLAVDTLIALQRQATSHGLPDLPPYDEEFLLREAVLLVDWYLPAATGVPPAPDSRDEYLALWRRLLPLAALPGPTLVLRDYHVDNLMLLPGRAGVQACGILDFQGALIGPAAYDLASLLADARRDVPPALRRAMTARYLAAFPDYDVSQFERSAAILSAQRNCKILGLFTRLARRDGKPQYLAHLPRVWRLVEEALADPVLAPLRFWLDRHLPAASRRGPL